MASSASVSQNVISWFESSAFDKPHLKSPQPCKRGVHCDYKLPDSTTGELVRACCNGVHPGEEGTGRRFFPARTLDGGRQQPACVRLTGASQTFYERRRLRMSWAEWCEKHGIPFTPALPGQPFEPLVRVPLGGKKASEQMDFRINDLVPIRDSGVSSLTPQPFYPYQPVQKQNPFMMSRGFLPMSGSATAEAQTPSRLSLSDPRPTERFTVSKRGGECSPDCCCPTGISCHDRTAPHTPRFAKDDESGFASPVLTRALNSNGDFENLD